MTAFFAQIYIYITIVNNRKGRRKDKKLINVCISLCNYHSDNAQKWYYMYHFTAETIFLQKIRFSHDSENQACLALLAL